MDGLNPSALHDCVCENAGEDMHLTGLCEHFFVFSPETGPKIGTPIRVIYLGDEENIYTRIGIKVETAVCKKVVIKHTERS